MKDKKVAILGLAVALLTVASINLSAEAVDAGILGIECNKVEKGTEHLFYFRSTTGRPATIRATDDSKLENCSFIYRIARIPSDGSWSNEFVSIQIPKSAEYNYDLDLQITWDEY